MRACFLGQNVCALGFGVATLQTPKLEEQPDVAHAATTVGDWPAGQQDGRAKGFLPLSARPSNASPAP